MAGLFFGCERAPDGVESAAPPAEIWKEFSGDNAFDHVRHLVELGPRPAGSEALEASRVYIERALGAYGWDVTRQSFVDDTPIGPVQFINLIARYAGPQGGPARGDTQRFIVGSHYDTKLYETIRFVGANDGGSSTGALIELARVLALDPAMARQAELVFFDGEEAFSQFSETDGLYGSRHYARQLVDNERVGQFEFGVIWDMIGETDLTITLPPDSPAELARGIFAAADALGLRNYFSYLNRAILDDHVPLNQAGIPTINLIDFDFEAWHTADDTLDKVSAVSIQKVASVTLLFLHQRLGREAAR